MLNVILVDDDIASIKLLSEILPWEKLGYSLSGIYSDGIQAIEHIKQHNVDLVVTDIAMSCMDGLKLCKICEEQFPDIKVILISAYRNFEYAKEAVSHKNVVDYITKPIDYAKFQALLVKICNELEIKQHYGFNPSNNDRLEFFSNLLCGYINSSSKLCEGFEKLHIADSVLKNPCYIVHFHICGFNTYINTVWQHTIIQLYNAIGNMFRFEDEYAYYSIANYSFGNFSWMILLKENQNTDFIISNFKSQITANTKSLLNMDIEDISQRSWKNPYAAIDTSYPEEFSDVNSANDITKVLEYMNSHYMENISLSLVAEQAFMAPAYFSAFFKKETGTNFIKTLTNIRLEHAAELLVRTNMMIAEICYAVGYNHIGNFLDKFKKKFKMTPNEYRKHYSNTNKD